MEEGLHGSKEMASMEEGPHGSKEMASMEEGLHGSKEMASMEEGPHGSMASMEELCGRTWERDMPEVVVAVPTEQPKVASGDGRGMEVAQAQQQPPPRLPSLHGHLPSAMPHTPHLVARRGIRSRRGVDLAAGRGPVCLRLRLGLGLQRRLRRRVQRRLRRRVQRRDTPPLGIARASPGRKVAGGQDPLGEIERNVEE
jgi:hypothetical protein